MLYKPEMGGVEMRKIVGMLQLVKEVPPLAGNCCHEVDPESLNPGIVDAPAHMLDRLVNDYEGMLVTGQIYKTHGPVLAALPLHQPMQDFQHHDPHGLG